MSASSAGFERVVVVMLVFRRSLKRRVGTAQPRAVYGKEAGRWSAYGGRLSLINTSIGRRFDGLI